MIAIGLYFMHMTQDALDFMRTKSFLKVFCWRHKSAVMTSLLILRVIMFYSLQVLCLSSQDYVSSLNAQKNTRGENTVSHVLNKTQKI